ncbi:MFS transporter [Archaeoglobus profundus]|uniref:Signal transduction protein with CBS domains n=1 Tax=Archaeoglobus profundus (strain DSM 5631 / JCM 9629 / NBRC 100127 / Av18) TaxID=572546 RepID=D2RDJ7_ARCPA|nr:MFS transporter [Archaeoglobus profundus]ADB58191.1 putative signal transduction protein with CBS domains [Archaeoglobus profundus DSM 5631]
MEPKLDIEFKGKEIARTVGIAWAGALLEWVDFYTYALLAGIVAHVFFPEWDPIAQLLASFGALALGFLFRPLGALIFGRIGDIYGRKVAFVAAAFTMLAGTLGIGILPGYAQIGILASVLVFVLRIIQGLALGGGFGATIVYLGESIPEKRRGFFTGFLFTTAPLGIAIVAAMISIIGSYFGADALNEWAWRIVFILSGLIVTIVALIMHFFYKETPVFTMLKTIRKTTSAPIRELFSDPKARFLVLLAWIGVIGAHGPIWYTNQLISKYYMTWHGVSEVTASTILSICTLLSAWAYIVFGALSDKIGRRKILLFGIYGNALAFIPVFWFMREAALAGNLPMLWILTYTLTFLNGIGYSGAMSAYLLELFPARIRLTATAFTYNLGYGITGGLTPLIITAIYRYIGDWYYSVISWSVVAPIVMGLFFVLKGWETLGTRIWEELSAGKFAKQALIVNNISLRELAKKLAENGYRSAVAVCGSSVKVIGEKTILRALAKGIDLDAKVCDVGIDVRCCDVREPLPIVLETMEAYNVRDVPVCSNGRIVGYIDARELLAETVGLRALAGKKIAERYRLKDIAKKPITIKSNATLAEAIRVMAENNIGILPIVNNGKLVAVFSERDAVRAIANGASLEDNVMNYATKNPKVVRSSDPVKVAIELMLNLNVRHVIGVENDRPRCVASVRDILQII